MHLPLQMHKLAPHESTGVPKSMELSYCKVVSESNYYITGYPLLVVFQGADRACLWWPYWDCMSFLSAAVTNNHKLRGLNNTHFWFYSSGGQSKMGFAGLQSRCWQGCIPSGGSRGQSHFRPFPASKGCPHSLWNRHWAGTPSPRSHLCLLPRQEGLHGLRGISF